jgi:hypothetical protein
MFPKTHLLCEVGTEGASHILRLQPSWTRWLRSQAQGVLRSVVVVMAVTPMAAVAVGAVDSLCEGLSVRIVE